MIPRVTDVPPRPEDRDDVEIGLTATQTANFNKSLLIQVIIETGAKLDIHL